MPITVTTVEITHNGNGLASQYTYDFRIDNKSAIQVYVSGVLKTEGTDYTVSGVGETNGGTVSFVASLVPASGTGNVKFFRDSDPVHRIDYSEGGALPTANLEASLDRTIMVVQEHRDEFTRVVRIPRTHTASSWNGSLPDPGVASNTSGIKLLAFRASGIALVNGSLVSTVDPLTTQGDLLTIDGAGAPVRKAIGSTGALLYVSGADLQYTSGASGTGTIPFYTGSAWGFVSAGAANTVLIATGSTIQYQNIASLVDSPQYVHNWGMEASTTSSALTFTIVGKNGVLPSAANIVAFATRSSVASTGTYSTVSIASTIQLTLNEGATLNIGAASTGRVYLYGIKDGEEAKLGIARQAIHDEGQLQSTTAITSAADAASVIYTVSALTNVTVRLLQVAEITAGAVAGSWESLPSVFHPWHSGMPKTGDIVQVESTTYNANGSTTTVIDFDDSIPPNTQGEEFMAQAITPKNALNNLEIEAHAFGTTSGTQVTLMALFQDSITNALNASEGFSSTDAGQTVYLKHPMVASAVASTTFKIRIGPSGAATYYFNSRSSGRLLGDIPKSMISVTERYA